MHHGLPERIGLRRAPAPPGPGRRRRGRGDPRGRRRRVVSTSSTTDGTGSTSDGRPRRGPGRGAARARASSMRTCTPSRVGSSGSVATCPGSHTREDYLAAIAAYALANPERPWILGGGWAMGAFPGSTATAADLDAIVPDRPVFLINRDHHGAWVNSRALELAGIGAHTPDPADGHLDRDDDGRPTGTLHEGAMGLVGRHLPGDRPRRSTTPASWRGSATCTRWA